MYKSTMLKVISGFFLIFVLVLSGCFTGSDGEGDPVLTGSVSITGIPQVEKMLTADTSGLDGNGTIRYQWKRAAGSGTEGITISGATGSTYTPAASDDVGKYLTVTVARDGYKDGVSSEAAGPVLAKDALSPVVDMVTVTSETPTVAKGGKLQFTATVAGTNNPAQTVMWTITAGGTGTGISSTGLLTVAVEEPAATLTVKAASTVDPAKFSTTVVTVTDFVATRDIVNVPVAAMAGIPLILAGAVMPIDATNKTIAWKVKTVGTTGASIAGNTLNAAATGTVVVTATIVSGTAQGRDFTKDFTITVEPKSVLGMTAGIVYDWITGNPLQGINVSLSGENMGGWSTVTGNIGTYVFRDVTPGDYTVTYQRDGYQSVSRKVTVNPVMYAADDPFNDTEIFEVLKSAGRADYIYYQNMRIELVGLRPLTGGVHGQLNLVKLPYELVPQSEVPAPIPVAKVKLWFVEKDRYGIGDPSTGTLNKYGPIVTDNNGNFSIDMLPLGTEFVMIYESFTTEDGHHFSGGDGIYNATYRQMDTLITYKKEKVNLGNLYIFLAETGLYVTGSTAGTASDPLEPKNGQIEITFSNPVNPSSFSAEFIALDEVNMTDPNWAGPFTYIWSEENKKVALKPVKGPHNQAEPAFPYSLNSYRPIGHLRLRGAGPDGKEIMGTDQTLAVPVFTAEGISLVAIDLNPDDIPSSRVMFVYSHAIKLIFSKPVRYAQFKLGRNTGSAVNVISTPDYTIGRLPDSKAEEVFVWTGGLLDTVLDLYYGVVSANDPNDMLGLDPSTGMLTISTTAANKIQSLLRHEAATPIAEVQ